MIRKDYLVILDGSNSPSISSSVSDTIQQEIFSKFNS